MQGYPQLAQLRNESIRVGLQQIHLADEAAPMRGRSACIVLRSSTRIIFFRRDGVEGIPLVSETFM